MSAQPLASESNGMNGRFTVSGPRTIGCSKRSSIASACETLAQRTIAPSSLRPFATARSVLSTFLNSGRVGLVCIIGRPISVAAAIVFESSIQAAASLREKRLISSTVRIGSRHMAIDSPSGPRCTCAGSIRRWRSPNLDDSSSSASMLVVRNSEAWIEASLIRWSGASGAIGLVQVIPPGVALRSTTSTSRPALAR